jgi:phosphatidylinositol alpha 1,6-mannosyltransferase
MRIACFSEVAWPMVSGVSRMLGRLLDALEDRGHGVRAYSAAYPLSPGRADDLRIHRSPGRPFFLSREITWASVNQRAVTDDLRRFRPDLVHLLTEFPVGLAGLRAARALGVPVIASAHTDYEAYAGRYDVGWAVEPGWHYLRWFYAQAARVLAPSAAYQRHLSYRGVTHTGIWSRGVDSDRFSPAARDPEWKRRLGLADTDPVVLSVGRLAPEKGVEVLLAAWTALYRTWPRAHLVFVGQGSLEPKIRGTWLPRVQLLGTLESDALARAYASSDILAFPSATETFGNVLLEGMASGLACVVADAGGVRDFARPGTNALMVAPGEAAALAGGLDLLLREPGMRRRLADGARRTALERAWGPVFDRLCFDYSEVLAAAPRVARARSTLGRLSAARSTAS